MRYSIIIRLRGFWRFLETFCLNINFVVFGELHFVVSYFLHFHDRCCVLVCGNHVIYLNISDKILAYFLYSNRLLTLYLTILFYTEWIWKPFATWQFIKTQELLALQITCCSMLPATTNHQMQIFKYLYRRDT